MRNKIDKDKFEELYRVCFDENDNIRACGRNACRELIRFLGSREYGSFDTGVMNAPAIVALHNEVMKG